MEIEYSTRPTTSDGHFLRAGISPQDNSAMKFSLAFESLAQTGEAETQQGSQ